MKIPEGGSKTSGIRVHSKKRMGYYSFAYVVAVAISALC